MLAVPHYHVPSPRGRRAPKLLRGLVDSRGRLLLDLFSANFRRSLRGSRERSGLVKPRRKNRQNTRTLHGSLV